jgi:hypothetical protein
MYSDECIERICSAATSDAPNMIQLSLRFITLSE